MIDFHTHILPGIDDGSRNTEMTEEMLREESRQGVSLVAATPHFYANQMAVEGFLKKRADAYEKTLDLIRKARDRGEEYPELAIGAEVYYFRGMGQAADIPKLCLTTFDERGAAHRTDTLLLEMPFEQWDEDVLKDVKDLIDKQKLNIVVAHIERYVEFQKDERIWDKVMALPLITQINGGTFLRKDHFLRKDRKKAFAIGWLREHPHMILGSDCHNLDSRRPNVGPARDVIARECGQDALTHLDETVRRALELR